MEGQRFDSLVKSLGALPGSRREALHVLGSGALTVVAGRFGLEESAAACVKVGKKCGKDDKCCAGAACKSGKCKCKAGTTQCGITCANLQSDEANCGACGNVCRPQEQCVGGGACVCNFPNIECGDACCPAGQVCFKGKCTVGQGGCAAASDACAQGQVSCNGGGCLCLQRFEGGGSRCVLPENSPGCATCNSDFDCDRDEGPGRVCVRGGAQCSDCTDSFFGFCAPLCPIQVGN